jgi:hypothetical protein
VVGRTSSVSGEYMIMSEFCFKYAVLSADKKDQHIPAGLYNHSHRVSQGVQQYYRLVQCFQQRAISFVRIYLLKLGTWMKNKTQQETWKVFPGTPSSSDIKQNVQCHFYRHNATQSHIYSPFFSQHVSASVGHLQVLALTPKLLYCIE